MKINWEDHIGLCYKICDDHILPRNRRLEQFRDDIIDDLKAKLWLVCEKLDYDPSKGAVSSYLCTALARELKTIELFYLGQRKGVAFDRQLNFVSYSNSHDGALIDTMEFHIDEPQPRNPQDPACRKLIQAIADMVDDPDDADWMRHYWFSDLTGRDIMALWGAPRDTDRLKPYKVMRRITDAADIVALDHPELVHDVFENH
jgi:hypothetical protein